MKSAGGVLFREIQASAEGLRELSRFYRERYVRAFPDANERESLANMKRYLRLKARGWYGKNNYHIVVAELAGRPIGGSVFDFLARPNAGVIEFLFIGGRYRGRGFGKALLDETTRLLRRDSRARLGKPLSAIVAEMNDPFRPAATPDNMDPFDRCELWGKWGFKRIQFPYVQPALSARQRPVDCLALIAKRLDDPSASSCSAAWVAAVVREYMRWAMRIPDADRNAEYRAMAAYLERRRRIPLMPLQSYVGRAAAPGLHVAEVTAPGRLFKQVLALLHRELDSPGLIVSERSFREALAKRGRGQPAYHLWALRRAPSAPPEGMASFFAMRPAGFGGYVALKGRLRGRGLLRTVLARIEEAMIRDRAGADGWFIECTAGSSAPFLKTGFAKVPVAYRPPSARGAQPQQPLSLLYKPFGAASASPAMEPAFVLDAIAAILKHVYGVEAPRRHACYVEAKRSLR